MLEPGTRAVATPTLVALTELAILRAIVAGERDPARLAELRNPACKASIAEITKALTGSWQPAALFVLHQALDFFDYYTGLHPCDQTMMNGCFSDSGQHPFPGPHGMLAAFG